MGVFHDSRSLLYRNPFGAAQVGEDITLRIAADFETYRSCALRVWIDGKGESFTEMKKEQGQEGTFFSCSVNFPEADIIWYRFVLTCHDGRSVLYGAKPGKTGGEGEICDYEPPSFQITVYEKRDVPAWYKNACIYQIFPDVFARDSEYAKRAEHLLEKRNGPERVLVEPWETESSYDKDEAGNITRWRFHAGSLAGIESKLQYLKDMGITVIYLNPVFEAASWHRYDTANYMKIDPLLGSEEDFRHLCKAAEEKGIRIILDGVFNHTGCDSIYFDRYGNYGGGAYGNPDSKYRSWFNFNDSPCGYDSWWGVADLPAVNEDEPSFRELIAGKDGVVRKWLGCGASGFRLDVADELPDRFICEIKEALLAEKEDGVLIGEVWEDASNKISYGQLRRYLLGTELDGVMNYPFRDAMIEFLLGHISAADAAEIFLSLQENYPKDAFYSGFNMLGSHDRPRILSILGEEPFNMGLAKARLWLALVVQMTFPGVPCIYYGDEAGMTGGADPCNRNPYPWGMEDKDAMVMHMGAMYFRKAYAAFTDGDFKPFAPCDDVFGCYRTGSDGCFAVLINRNRWEKKEFRFEAPAAEAAELVSGKDMVIEDGKALLQLGPLDSAVIRFGKREPRGAKLERGAGVICHVTSLPGFSEKGLDAAYGFIDNLSDAGVRYWQMLPINPTDEYGSPYAGTSAFAGNVNLLCYDRSALERLYGDFKKSGKKQEEYKAFLKENEYWINGYMAAFGKDGEFEGFCQYLFDREWLKVKQYAASKGIKLVGDIPMFVSAESIDAKQWKKYFKLAEDGTVSDQAGVPPDSFSEEGQLWGNPLYDWDELEKDGFEWWLQRLQRLFRLFDYVRLDHFRGFEASWCVPGGKTAKEGRWVKAKGMELFEAAHRRFGPLPVIAEDLGVITPAVRVLLDVNGFPGMDVLQFSDSDPFEYKAPKGKVVYSGTHDNDTLVGWCEKSFPEKDAEKCAEKLLEVMFKSDADVVFVPLQDAMLLGSDARMNVPGSLGKNWSWQAEKKDMGEAISRLRRLVKVSGR